MCMLSAMLYMIDGSVIVSTGGFRGFRLPLDTATGFNLIRRTLFPFGSGNNIDVRYRAPKLNNANVNQLRL